MSDPILLAGLRRRLAEAPLSVAERTAWRGRASQLGAAWRASGDPRIELDAATLARVGEVARTIHQVVAGHEPARPGHGPEHAARVEEVAEHLIGLEGLDPLDAARLRLAAPAHDLGRLVAEDDTAALAHAEASAVLLAAVTQELGLPDAIVHPAAYAVLVHSRPHRGDETAPRVVDDLRTSDKWDAIGPQGLVRSLAYYGRFPERSLSLGDRAAFADGGALHGWWRIVSNFHPIVRSPRMAELALVRRRADLALIDVSAAPGDPVELAGRALERVEATSDDALFGGLLRRLAVLPPDERARWAGLLGVVLARLEDSEG